MNMVFTLVITVFYAIFETIGLLGNLLVITTILLDSRFHVMRYVALASLAVSDFLYLILVPSFRIASMVQGRWPFGEMFCNLNTNFARYFYFNTILHLIVISYDRYRAIVKSPLTYDGTISTAKKVSMVISWIVPIPFFITPFLRGRKFHYNPLVFYCEVGLWSSPSSSENTQFDGAKAMLFTVFLIVLPLLVIVFFNWSVYKTAKTHINAFKIQIESVSGSEESQQRQQQEMIRRKAERRAAADVNIIVTKCSIYNQFSVAFILHSIKAYFFTCSYFRILYSVLHLKDSSTSMRAKLDDLNSIHTLVQLNISERLHSSNKKLSFQIT